jgi:ribonuclease P protein component
MIAKRFRFHNQRAISNVLRSGWRLPTRYWTIKWRPAPRAEHARLAVIVSRKVAKGAVMRNRIRRRLFETLRLKLPIDWQPVDLVVLIHDAAVVDLPQPDLDQLIQNQLEAIRSRQNRS